MMGSNVMRGVTFFAGLLLVVNSVPAQVAKIPSPPADLRVDGGQTVPTQPDPSSSLGAGWTLDETKVGLAPHGLSCDSLPVYSGANPIPRGSRISKVRFTRFVDLSEGTSLLRRVASSRRPRPERGGDDYELLGLQQQLLRPCTREGGDSGQRIRWQPPVPARCRLCCSILGRRRYATQLHPRPG